MRRSPPSHGATRLLRVRVRVGVGVGFRVRVRVRVGVRVRVRVGVRLRVRVRVNLVLLDGTLDADPLAPRHLRAEEDHLVGSEGWGCGERVGAGPGVGRPAARGC